MDFIPAIIWLVIIITIGMVRKNAHPDDEHYKYYMPNLLLKVLFSFSFALVYIFVYDGGDTTAYFESASALNNLLFEDPSLYFKQLFFDYTESGYHLSYFTVETGYPPGWIFREPEGFFVAKIISVFSFLTMKSYLGTTFIMAFLTANASWKLFEFIRSFNLNNEKWLAFGILFLPSVNFWCTGVSKDSVVFIAAVYLIIHSFQLISHEKKGSLRNILLIFIYALTISHIRNFILIAILLPIGYSWIISIAKGKSTKSALLPIIQIVSFVLGLIVIGFTMSSTQSEDQFLESNTYLQEAAVVQDDFQNNDIYGTKRYSLGEISFTPLGLLKVAPIAIFAGIYKPLVWEALSPTLILNGLESLLIFYFTFLFFQKNIRQKIKYLRKHEILVFCFIFVLILAFMTGLTSVLFGVLVRLRAPLLPFLFILLTIEWKVDKLDNKYKSADEN